MAASRETRNIFYFLDCRLITIFMHVPIVLEIIRSIYNVLLKLNLVLQRVPLRTPLVLQKLTSPLIKKISISLSKCSFNLLKCSLYPKNFWHILFYSLDPQDISRSPQTHWNFPVALWIMEISNWTYTIIQTY